MAEKKQEQGTPSSGGGTQTQQSPQPQAQGSKSPKGGSSNTKMKVHLESTGPIFTIGGYGPMYNMELEKDVVLMLLREGIYVTDVDTRKRIVLVNGEPGIEQ